MEKYWYYYNGKLTIGLICRTELILRAPIDKSVQYFCNQWSWVPWGRAPPCTAGSAGVVAGSEGVVAGSAGVVAGSEGVVAGSKRVVARSAAVVVTQPCTARSAGW